MYDWDMKQLSLAMWPRVVFGGRRLHTPVDTATMCIDDLSFILGQIRLLTPKTPIRRRKTARLD